MFKGGDLKPVDNAPKCELEGTYDYKPCNATSKKVEEKPCAFVAMSYNVEMTETKLDQR